jgi:hypothetical protein
VVATDVHDLRDAVGDGDADEIDVALEDGVGSADLHGDAVGDDVAGREGAEPHATTTISRAQRIPWVPSRTIPSRWWRITARLRTCPSCSRRNL